MAGLLQGADFKTVAELTANGGAASDLLNDQKIYVTANGINKTLAQAIIDGDFGGGAGMQVNAAIDVQTTVNAGVTNNAIYTAPANGYAIVNLACYASSGTTWGAFQVSGGRQWWVGSSSAPVATDGSNQGGAPGTANLGTSAGNGQIGPAQVTIGPSQTIGFVNLGGSQMTVRITGVSFVNA